MRIRSTKPEFWRSKTIAALPWEVRFVLKGIESYVDDNGVGKDDVALIAADVFPRDLASTPTETLARLSEALNRLAEGGLIIRYEYDGEDLLYVDRWNKQQRIDKPAKGRFRRPDGTLEYADEVDRDSYAKPREDVAISPEVLAPGTGEQGNRGVPTTSAIANRDGDEPAISEVVKAYVEGAASAGLPRPSERLRGKVGQNAKRLATKEQVPVGALIAAARSMGERGWDDIDRELQRLAVNTRPKGSTTDERVASTLALAERFQGHEGIAQ